MASKEAGDGKEVHVTSLKEMEKLLPAMLHGLSAEQPCKDVSRIVVVCTYDVDRGVLYWGVDLHARAAQLFSDFVNALKKKELGKCLKVTSFPGSISYPGSDGSEDLEVLVALHQTELASGAVQRIQKEFDLVYPSDLICERLLPIYTALDDPGLLLTEQSLKQQSLENLLSLWKQIHTLQKQVEDHLRVRKTV